MTTPRVARPAIQPPPPQYDGWRGWWRISVTNRLLRLICTVVGGLFVAAFAIAGAYQTAGVEAGAEFDMAVLIFAIVLLVCLVLDLKLVWTFQEFAMKHQAVLVVHLFAGWALGILFAWHYGVPVLRDLSWWAALALGQLFLLAAALSGVLFTLCIGGPSRVTALCAAASVAVGAYFDGSGVFTRVEVWAPLIELLPIEADWLTWACAVILGLSWFYDRQGGFFDF